MDEISPLIIEKDICWNASTLMRNDQLWMDCMWHLGDSSFLMGSAQTEPRTWAKNFCVSARKWRRYLESIQIFIINYPSQVRKLFQLMSSLWYFRSHNSEIPLNLLKQPAKTYTSSFILNIFQVNFEKILRWSHSILDNFLHLSQ